MTKEQTGLCVIRKADLRFGDAYEAFEDPDKLARMSPEKRRAVLENPFCTDDQAPVQILGTIGRRVIGRLDLIAGEARAGRTRVPMLWTSALFVLPQFRKTLMGATLLMQMQRLHHTLGSCGVSRHALPVLEKLKWVDLPMQRYVLLRKSRAVVERFVPRRVLSRAASALADAALLAHRELLAAWTTVRARDLSCEQVATMAPGMDELLERHAGPVGPSRTSRWVNWLLESSFTGDPRERRGLFHVYDKERRLLGYFLVKVQFHSVATHREFKDVLLGSLSDWMIFAPSSLDFDQIALLASQVLLGWSVDAVEICVPPSTKSTDLRALGFVPAGELHLLIKLSAASPLRALEGQPPEAWRVRPGDGDNFFS